MEVHHHPHVEKKGLKEYLLEGMMIFLAVSLGFIAENIREHITERRVAEELAENLYREALLDSADAHEAIGERLQVKEKHVDLFIDYVRDSSLNSVSDTFMRHFFAGFLNNVYFEPNDGVLSQLKNSGSLRYLKNSKLQQEIGRYSVAIANVRTRNAQERDLVQFNVRPFMLSHYDFSGFEANQQHLGRLTKEETRVEEKRELVKPRILNADQFNKEEAVNLAFYYLMIIRGTRRFEYASYADENHKLLETLREEYHFQ